MQRTFSTPGNECKCVTPHPQFSSETDHEHLEVKTLPEYNSWKSAAPISAVPRKGWGLQCGIVCLHDNQRAGCFLSEIFFFCFIYFFYFTCESELKACVPVSQGWSFSGSLSLRVGASPQRRPVYQLWDCGRLRSSTPSCLSFFACTRRAERWCRRGVSSRLTGPAM